MGAVVAAAPRLPPAARCLQLAAFAVVVHVALSLLRLCQLFPPAWFHSSAAAGRRFLFPPSGEGESWRLPS